jgi:hypothetical protein
MSTSRNRKKLWCCLFLDHHHLEKQTRKKGAGGGLKTWTTNCFAGGKRFDEGVF